MSNITWWVGGSANQMVGVYAIIMSIVKYKKKKRSRVVCVIVSGSGGLRIACNLMQKIILELSVWLLISNFIVWTYMLGLFGESCWDQFGVFVCFMRDIVGIQLGSFLHSSGIVFASCWDPLGIMFGFMWSSGWGSFMVVYTFKMCFCGRLYTYIKTEN